MSELLEDESGYRARHRALTRRYGPAKDHACSSCGEQALDWALIAVYVTPEMYGRKIYSENDDAYTPLCRSCHTTQDRAGVIRSDEHRARMAESNRGVKRSAETRSKMSESAYKRKGPSSSYMKRK